MAMVAIFDDEASMEQHDAECGLTDNHISYHQVEGKHDNHGTPPTASKKTRSSKNNNKRPPYAIMAEIAIVTHTDRAQIDTTLQIQVDRLKNAFLHESIVNSHCNSVDVLMYTCKSCVTMVAKAILHVFETQTFNMNQDDVQANSEWNNISKFMRVICNKFKNNMTSLCKTLNTVSHEVLSEELVACLQTFCSQAKVKYVSLLEKGVKLVKPKNEVLHLQRQLAEAKRAIVSLQQAVNSNAKMLFAINEDV